ncbi:sugar kinase [Oryzicola mucosus]|uniref:Sugar kinase n=1 Tax=Oryzicola mucosus TaxID=2767425 RepID=A0A8J6PK03_9HYPH|nr:sugar kinase [Oryzicola mucosus]MBD0415056.1 sugar kinase [Oryzicola mucosus]
MSGVIGSLGELLVEFVCTEKDSRHKRASTYKGPYPSGAPAIFIDQAARMGASTIFVGAVGDDAFGTVLRDRLVSVGVSQGMIRTVPGIPTGSAFVAYNSDGSRDFVFNMAHSAAARFAPAPEAIEGLLKAGVSVFHISGSSLGNPAMAAAALEVCVALHAKDVAISFDPNIRVELMEDSTYIDTVRRILAMASYALPSIEDTDLLFPGERFEDYAPRLQAAGARYVVLKKGAKGCQGIGPAGAMEMLDAHAVEVVDPTGAGDCFCATFVALITSGRFGFREALERANAAGALAVGKVGPMEGNSSLDEVEAFLETLV